MRDKHTDDGRLNGLSSFGSNPAVSTVPASIPDARPMTMVWNTDAGAVVFTFPSNLGATDVSDIRDLLNLTLRGMERRAQALEARRAATTGAVHESAVGNADAPETKDNHHEG